jgi:hypothetical protein
MLSLKIQVVLAITYINHSLKSKEQSAVVKERHHADERCWVCIKVIVHVYMCTVVFALIVMEPASGKGVGLATIPPHPKHTNSLAGSVKINAKTTVHCSPGSSMPTSLSLSLSFSSLSV